MNLNFCLHVKNSQLEIMKSKTGIKCLYLLKISVVQIDFFNSMKIYKNQPWQEREKKTDLNIRSLKFIVKKVLELKISRK